MRTLIVMDMQECFEAACDPDVVIGVTKEIILAKERQSPIVLVEYAECGRSHEGFSSLLRGYPWKARISKWDDDGSAEIIRTLRRRNFDHHVLRLCGVNADCCVHATVTGLLERLEGTQLEVVKQACGWEGRFTWQEYVRHPNLKLV
jgi:nicotinamidase-related amidase